MYASHFDIIVCNRQKKFPIKCACATINQNDQMFDSFVRFKKEKFIAKLTFTFLII